MYSVSLDIPISRGPRQRLYPVSPTNAVGGRQRRRYARSWNTRSARRSEPSMQTVTELMTRAWNDVDWRDRYRHIISDDEHAANMLARFSPKWINATPMPSAASALSVSNRIHRQRSRWATAPPASNSTATRRCREKWCCSECAQSRIRQIRTYCWAS